MVYILGTTKDKDTEHIISRNADHILSFYNQRSILYKDVLDTLSTNMSIQEIEQALRYLEEHDQIYVERFHRLLDGGFTTNIGKFDLIYFNTYPTISRRTLLYKTGVEYGDYTINHVLGCAHGCNYPCYAMQISKRYGRITDYIDWMHPRLVRNAEEILERELPKLNSKIEFVHLSFMTDPFMYDILNKRNFSWIKNSSLAIIERLNRANLKVTVLTKGLLPLELANLPYSKLNEYGITITSFNRDFHEKYEPFSLSAEERLRRLELLHKYGLKTWVSLEPYPTPNIVEQNLQDILDRIRFVDKIIFGQWNYNKEVSGYENNRKFYTECSDLVIEFCKMNKIQLHIKKLTPKSRIQTQNLFKQTGLKN